MILVDTSVWVDHLRSGVPDLVVALERAEVCVHPFVIGELACGNLRNRHEVLDLLTRLPSLPAATDVEALALIERRSLMARGLGYIDIHLLTSILIAPPTHLWTRDRHLAEVAAEMGFARGE